MKKTYLIIAFVLSFSIGVVGSENTSEEVQNTLEKSLDEMNLKIESLEKDIEKTSGAVKTDLKSQVEKLKSEKEEVKKQLKNLKGKSGKAWAELKAGALKALENLEEAYKKAKDEFAKDSTKN